MRHYLAISLLSFWGVSVLAANDESCRSIENNMERLACYDQQVDELAKVAAKPSESAPQPVETTSVVSEKAIDNFGLVNKKDAVLEIRSSIAGAFKGWSPKTEFILDNGQIWRVVDGSSASFNADSPKVEISTGAFGAFYFRVDGLNKSPRVKRVK